MVNSPRSLMTVNALVLAGLGIGFLNHVLVAAVFGLTREVDAFYAAQMLPTLFMVLCVDYLGKNFLPTFARARTESEETASTMTSSIVTIMGLLAVAVIALLLVFSRPLFAILLPGFDATNIGRVVEYFHIMAPAMLFMAITTFHEYVCQYDDQFVPITLIRMTPPIANVAAIAVLAPFIGEYCLPVGYLVGNIVVCVLVTYRARYRYRPRVLLRKHLEQRVFRNSAIVMTTGIFARSRSIIVNYIASTLGSGAISAIALTMKLIEPIDRGAFAGAKMVMFSHTARLFAEKNLREAGHLYRIGLGVAFFLLAPLVWWIALNSVEVVHTLFARGEFTREMTLLVAATLVALIPSVLFRGVDQLMSNAFYAMDRVKVPAIVMPLSTLVYVAFAIPLSQLFGTPGLAMSTTFMQIVMFTALFACLSRVLPDIRPLRTAAHLLGYTALAGIVMTGTNIALESLGLSPAVVATASLPLGAIMYAGVLALIGDETYQRVLTFARGVFVARNAAA
jgi:peptidoglycan biosynthesis protein MviN/MurJ (putative lipid II flippase)